MNSKEYFNLFYIDGTDGIFRENKTANKIPQFISHTIITDKEIRKKLPDEFNFHTWLKDGKGSPLRLWGDFARYYNEEVFSKALLNEIDDFRLEELCERVGVPASTSKEILCVALAKQFEAIILGKGVAEDIIADIVAEAITYSRFTPYIDAASRRYNVMKLINAEEVLLSDFFVCNTIGEKERVFDFGSPLFKGEKLEYPNVNAHTIRNMFIKRGYDNVKTLLIGSGGCGKSLMLQHLFLQSASEYAHTGVLPIFLELRNLTQNTDFVDYIIETVSDTVQDFGDTEALELFEQGTCQLFLDGFDEIDPTDMPSFLNKLNKFTDKYTNVQIIITSRINESTPGLKGFKKLYVWPFNTEQTYELVDKILKYKEQEHDKDSVMAYIESGVLKKNGIFASHPLLLTYVTLHYPDYRKYNDNPLQFYRNTYEALLSGHDNNKKPYDRVFMSVDNASQFSKVFREFCAITYRDAAFSFDSSTFEGYFEQLQAYKEFENPKKMNIENFKHDVCSTACMMYEKNDDLYYIDPVFQKFLFADYYSQAAPAITKELVDHLSKNRFTMYKDFEALDMFYKQTEEKVKVCLIRPYLDKIFKSGTEEDMFRRFIIHGFDQVYYSVLNTDVSDSYLVQLTFMMTSITEPYNIILSYILKILGLKMTFSYMYSGSEQVFRDLISSVFLGLKTAYENTIEIHPISKTEIMLPSFKETHELSDYIESDGDYLSFGHEYVISAYDLYTDPDKYKEPLKILMSVKCEFYTTFLRVKEYYEILKKEQFRNNMER